MFLDRKSNQMNLLVCIHLLLPEQFGEQGRLQPEHNALDTVILC